jgi:murein DD-endopeptidase MepM/ murein hydrolase activator NlpD
VFGEHTRRRWRRSALAVAIAVAAALLVPTTGRADPLGDARARVAAAQEAADAATARYSDAQTREAELSHQVEELETAIKTGKDRAAALRVAAERSAVTAYTTAGGRVPFDGLGSDDAIVAARREKLLEEATAADNDAVERLARVNDDLQEQRTDLEQRRAEAEAALAAMEAEARQLEADLAAAQRAQAEVEEQLRLLEAARQAAEREKEARQRASAGASGVVVDGLVCPIRGAVSFVDSWHAPRHQGPHMGVDLMAARGTPNVATVSGNAEMRGGGISGNGVRLHGDDGNLYYYFHLDSYEGGSRHVAQGEVVGYTGNTGDASGGATHTHFEIHPGGGAAVNPYPAVKAVC